MGLRLFTFTPPTDEEPLYSLVADQKTQDILAIIWWGERKVELYEGVTEEQKAEIQSATIEPA